MSRLPYAAKQFISEAEKIRSTTKHEATDDVDGFNVHRTLKFDKRTSKWLAKALDELEDSRIADYHLTDAGYLHVTFVSGPEADTRHSFLLEDAVTVSSDSEPK